MSHDQHEAKHSGFVFLHIFQLIRMKFDMARKKLKLNIRRLLFIRFEGSREITAVLLAASKELDVYIHLNIYEPVWYKLNVMTVTTELCSLLLVDVILTLIQGYRDGRKPKLQCQFSHTLFNGLRWSFACC